MEPAENFPTEVTAEMIEAAVNVLAEWEPDLIECKPPDRVERMVRAMLAAGLKPVLAPEDGGCICPPGSEATCQGLGCPRKPPTFISTGI